MEQIYHPFRVFLVISGVDDDVIRAVLQVTDGYVAERLADGVLISCSVHARDQAAAATVALAMVRSRRLPAHSMLSIRGVHPG